MVVTSVVTLLALGFCASLILAVASRLLYVKEDPRIGELLDALPGANCGGCGYAGCEAYATAVLNDPDVPSSLCVAGGKEVSDAVAALSGKASGSAEANVAVRRCERQEGNVQPRYEYRGIDTCAAAAAVDNGPFKCSWSCLGLGDCEKACPFDALHMIGTLAVIDPEKCTGCGICVKTCPRGVLELAPKKGRIRIHCATKAKMKAVKEVCDVGCISCARCVKKCPAKALSLDSGRLQIDHALCLAYGPSCGELCLQECPRKILRAAPVRAGSD